MQQTVRDKPTHKTHTSHTPFNLMEDFELALQFVFDLFRLEEEEEEGEE